MRSLISVLLIIMLLVARANGLDFVQLKVLITARLLNIRLAVRLTAYSGMSRLKRFARTYYVIEMIFILLVSSLMWLGFILIAVMLIK